MKKTILIGQYQLRIFNDGTSGHIWIHPWKIPKKISSKDITLDPIWDKSNNLEDLETDTSSLEDFETDTSNLNICSHTLNVKLKT